MKGIRGFLGAHKRVFALGVFFCCILLSAFMLIPSFGGVGAAKRDAAAGDFTAEAKPLHAYTKLEVEMPKGLTVYTGKTTVREFKENLTVIGTYKPSAASSEVSVELLPSEYLLVDNTGANIDVKDDEPVMRNSTEGGQPNSVDCGSASAPVGDIAIEDEYPILADDTVFSVSVKDGMEIENVNTSESIKKLLEISYEKADGTTGYIGNKELYDVSFAGGSLSVGKNKITVTYKGQTPNISSVAEITVTAAQNPQIAVNVNPDLIYEDGAYKYNGDYNGESVKYSAFVAGMRGSDIYSTERGVSRLQITLVYKSVFFTAKVGEFGISGISVVEPESGSYAGGAQTVAVQVVFGNTPRTGEGVIPFDTVKPVKVAVNKYKETAITNGEYTFADSGENSASTATRLNKDDFDVTVVYNDTSTYNNKAADADSSRFSVDNTLMFDGQTIPDSNYDKKVRVSSAQDSEIYSEINFKNIKPDTPVGVVQIILDAAAMAKSQTVNKEFDLSGLSAVLRYSVDGKNVNIPMPLSEHPEWCEFSYANANTYEDCGEGYIIPSTALGQISVSITFKYNFQESLSGRVNFNTTVDRTDYSFPALNTRAVDYSTEGCFKTFENLIENLQADAGKSVQGITVEITTLGGSGVAGGKHAYDSESGTVTLTEQKTAEFAEYSSDGKITFKQGGTFTVTLRLDSDVARWENPDTLPGGLERLSDFVISYTVQINKARLNVHITEDGKETTSVKTVYGDAETFLMSLGIRSTVYGTETYIPADTEPDFKLYISGNGLTDVEFDPHSLPDLTKESQLKAGSYTLTAKTDPDNMAYKLSESSPITFMIERRTVKANGLINEKIYDRSKDYSSNLGELVSTNPDDFKYEDTSANSVSITSGDSPITHVRAADNPYIIKLTLINENYMWDDTVSDYNVTDSAKKIAEVGFNITPRTLSMKAAVGADSFVYGNAIGKTALNPQAVKTDDGCKPGCGSAETHFYAVIDENPIYCKVNSDGTLDKTKYYDIDSDILDVGTYAVYYGSKRGEGDEELDYELPAAYATFSVTPKPVANVTLKESGSSYDATVKNIRFDNFDSDIMKYSVVGKSFYDFNDDGENDEILNEQNKNAETFNVTKAAVYTLTVEFKDEQTAKNYKWDNGSNTQEKLTYTVSRASVTPNWNKTEFIFEDSPTENKYPELSGITGNRDGASLTFGTKVYMKNSDGSYTEITDKSTVKASGEYRLVAVLANTDTSAADIVANYMIDASYGGDGFGRVPDNEELAVWVKFVIRSASLKMPVMVGDSKVTADSDAQKFTVTFSGDSYDILSYILEATEGGNVSFGNRLKVEVVGGGESNALRDVRANGYRIRISPETNYEWSGEVQGAFGIAEDGVLEYTFEIKPLEVDIIWDVSHIDQYNGSAQTPVINSIDGNKDGNGVSADIYIGTSADNADINGQAVNAGEYYAVARLKGDKADNYTISAGNTTYIKKFVIQRKELGIPSFEGSDRFYDETDKTASLNGWADISDKVSFEITLNVDSQGNDLSGLPERAGKFENGTFTYVDAGSYKVEFTITDGNYRFADGAETDYENLIDAVLSKEISLSVKRKEITLNGWIKRTYTREEGKTQKPGALGEDGYGNSVSVSSDSVTIGINLTHELLGSADNTFINRGSYKAVYTLADGNVGADVYSPDSNPYNYKWVVGDLNKVDPAIKSLLVDENGNCAAVDDGGTTLYVYYAVTGQILTLGYDFKGYTFGDNTDANGNETENFIGGKFAVTGSDSDLGVLADAEDNLINGYTIEFYKNSVSVGSAEYSFKDGIWTYNKGGDLEAAMPWNAGKYTVKIKWNLDTNSEFQIADYSTDINEKEFEFEVSRLTVSAAVDLSKLPEDFDAKADASALTATYKGAEYAFAEGTVYINNAPKRGGTEAEKPKVRLNVKNGDAAVKNAGTYKFNIAFVSGEDSSNYAINADTVVAELTISPKSVTVQANANGHTYGDSPETVTWSVVNGGFANDGEQKLAEVYLSATFAGITNLGNFTPKGEYKIGFIKKTDTDESEKFWQNYDFAVSETAVNYTVSARPVTVGVKKTNITVTYGDELKLGAVTAGGFDELYSITNMPDGEDSGSVLFETYAEDGKGGRITKYSDANEDGYAVLIDESKNNPNYTITFDESAYKYIVLRATLKVKVDISVFFGERGPNNFDGSGNTYKADYSDIYAENGIYTVADGGFKFEDRNTFYNNNASASWSGTLAYICEYSQWGTPSIAALNSETEVGREEIVFAPVNLVWGNYKFEADANYKGYLTVKKRAFSVEPTGIEIPYYSPMQSLTHETIASALGSSYEGVSGVVPIVGGEFNTFDAIFALRVTPELSVEGGVVTADINKYGFAFDYVGNAGKFYIVTLSGGAVYEIIAADYANQDELDAVPSTKEHTYSESEFDAIDSITATTVDAPKSEAKVEYALNGGTWSSAVPKIYNAGTYTLKYCITAANHKTIERTVTVTVIGAANNVIKDFTANGKDTSGSLSSAPEVWTYGGYGSNTPFAAPVSEFDGVGDADGGNKFGVTLLFSRGSESRTFTGEIPSGDDAALKALFAVWFGPDGISGFNFEAGNYRITFAMKCETNVNGEKNYSDISYVRYFKVGKAVLTVKPDDDSVTYGEAYPFDVNYGYTIVMGEQYADRPAAADAITAADFTWQTNYEPGKPYGDYVISNKSAAEKENYEFAFEEGVLKVVKRVIEITIANRENVFNLTNDPNKDKANLDGLITRIEGVYDAANQTPVILATQAFDHSAIDTSEIIYVTNEIGEYPIYLMWNGNDKDGVAYSDNYTVKFVGCKDWGNIEDFVSLTGAISQNGKLFGGTYKITPAQLYATIGENKTVYNGGMQELSVTVSDSLTDGKPVPGVKFNVEYAPNGTADWTTDRPVNAMVYSVRATYVKPEKQTKDNYVVSNMVNTTFTVSPAKLKVHVGQTEIEYGTAFTGSVPWNISNGSEPENLGADSRFKGYTLVFSVEGEVKTLQQIIAQEEANRKGDFRISAFTFASDYSSGVNAAATAANENCGVTVGGILSNNYEIEQDNNGSSLKVVPRKLTLTITGATGSPGASKDEAVTEIGGNTHAQAVYDGNSKAEYLQTKVSENFGNFFTGFSGNWAGESGITAAELNLTLSISSTVDGKTADVGKYKMSRIAVPGKTLNPNFEFTFLENEPYFIITKKAASVTVTYSGVAGKSETEYGDAIALGYSFEGFVNYNYGTTDNEYQTGTLGSVYISKTHAFGDKATYSAWNTAAGTYYLRYDIENLWFRNYKLSCGEDTEIVLKQRLISLTPGACTAEGSNGKYIYNNGKVINGSGGYSSEVTPEYTFGGADGALPGKEPGVSLSYTGKGSRPVNAGDYTVTADLGANSNYRFDSTGLRTMSFSFAIEKLEVNIGWRPEYYYDFIYQGENNYAAQISAFDAEFMKVTSFYRMLESGNETIGRDDTGADGKYAVGSDGKVISFVPAVQGTYRIEIELDSSDDLNNYMLVYGADKASGFILTLEVRTSSDRVQIDIRLESSGGTWVYSTADPVVNATANGEKIDVTPTYAVISDAEAAEKLISSLGGRAFHEYTVFDGYDGSQNAYGVLTDLGIPAGGFGSYDSRYGGNAGLYVMRIQYNGHNGYYIFEVTKKGITRPGASVESSIYNGTNLPRDIAFNGDWGANAVRVSISSDKGNACYVSPLNGNDGVTLNATNAGTYNVIFTLTSSNYEWLGDGDVSAPVTVVWTVNKGKDAVKFAEESVSTTYGVGFNVHAISAFGGAIRYGYINKKNLASEPTEESVYESTVPKNAGEYWVVAFSADGDNFDGGFGFASLTVNKAVLHAAPNGTSVYGSPFEPNGNYGYNLTGFVNGETSSSEAPSAVRITYILFGKDGTTDLTDTACKNPLDINVGTYVLRLEVKTESGFNDVIDGLIYDNYIVRLTDGEFTVTRKAVNVTVNTNGDTRTSEYGNALKLGLSGVKVDFEAVRSHIALMLKAGNGSEYGENAFPDAGTYDFIVVAASGHETQFGNYVVTVDFDKKYEVTKKKLEIGEISITGGNVDTAKETKVGTIIAKDGSELADALAIVGRLAYTYSGAGVADGAFPAGKVGTYSVQITLSAADSINYEFDCITAFPFSIGTRTLSGKELIIMPQVYNGTERTPKITYGDYSDERFGELFEVTFAGGAVNVGKYNVTVTIRESQTANYGWENMSSPVFSAVFEITPATNRIEKFEIAGWTYGKYNAAENAPRISTTFDPKGENDRYDFIYSTRDGHRIEGIPTQAGDYNVRVRVISTNPNYVYDNSDSDVAEVTGFTIAKAVVTLPGLGIVSEGDNKNDTYTGGILQAGVNGFDSVLMNVFYDGVTNLAGTELYVQATNAGTYTVKVGLKDSANYTWGSGANADSDGNIVLTWTVAKKKIALPFDSGKKMIVNGKVLEYIPEGFDPSVMTITDNLTGYGGTFTAKISLADTANYEWENGSTDVVEIEWSVIGSNTVFGIVIGSISGVCAALAAVAAVMYFKLRKKKKLEADAEAV